MHRHRGQPDGADRLTADRVGEPGSATAFSDPGSAYRRCGRLLAADVAALLFVEAAPDARVLIRLERVLEAVGLHGALAADLLGAVDLHEGLTGGAIGKNRSGSVSRQIAWFRHV